MAEDEQLLHDSFLLLENFCDLLSCYMNSNSLKLEMFLINLDKLIKK